MLRALLDAAPSDFLQPHDIHQYTGWENNRTHVNFNAYVIPFQIPYKSHFAYSLGTDLERLCNGGETDLQGEALRKNLVIHEFDV